MKRDRDGARVMRLRVRILTRPEAELAVIGMEVRRNIVDVDADVGGAQRGEGSCAAPLNVGRVQLDDIEMPCGRTVRIAATAADQGKSARSGDSVRLVAPALAPRSRRPPMLAAPQRGLDVRHAVVPAELMCS